MRIPDSTILPIHNHVGSEQYSSRETPKSFSALQHIDMTSIASRSPKASDVVNLTVQARLNSKLTQTPTSVISAGQTTSDVIRKQTPSSVKINSADQSAPDYETKGAEAIVQLIEMLTGIKVKLLTQADLLEAEKMRQADIAKMVEQQGQTSPAEASMASSYTENVAVQSKGTLKFTDGTVVPFSLDMALPKDDVNVSGLNLNHDSLSRDGMEVYVYKSNNETTVQEHALSKSDTVASEKELKKGKKASSIGDISGKSVEKNTITDNSGTSGVLSSVGPKSKVIGRVTIDYNLETAGNRYIVSV